MGCNCAGNKTANLSYEYIKEVATSFGQLLFKEKQKKVEIELYKEGNDWCYREKGTDQRMVNVLYTIVIK
jgi:hypothetical protein